MGVLARVFVFGFLLPSLALGQGEKRRDRADEAEAKTSTRGLNAFVYEQSHLRSGENTQNTTRIFKLAFSDWSVSDDGDVSLTSLSLGAGNKGGFAFALQKNYGLELFHRDFFGTGLYVGSGVDGLTGTRIPFAFSVPVGAFIRLDIGPKAQVLLRSDLSWHFITDRARRKGSESVSFADEWRSQANVAVYGAYLGIALREWMGTRDLVGQLGVSIFSEDE